MDTGTKPHSGTTANVFLTIFGKDGSSPKLRLRYKNEEEGFRKGKKDTFHHTVDDVGPIVRCRFVGTSFRRRTCGAHTRQQRTASPCCLLSLQN